MRSLCCLILIVAAWWPVHTAAERTFMFGNSLTAGMFLPDLVGPLTQNAARILDTSS